MRLAVIGYGAVAAIHARRMGAEMVYGPDAGKAQAFAEAHGVPWATGDLNEALRGAGAAIICSPSHLHYEQTLRALGHGVATLVELPACGSLDEARSLEAAAGPVALVCAHTSRYLEPYRRIRSWIASGRLGEIRQVRYTRSVPPRKRSWSDDALHHHAEHPLDLFLDWFGELTPLACAGTADRQDVALAACLTSGAPVSIAISYTARLAACEMTVTGAAHTVVTDGFSYIRSDDDDLDWQGDGQTVYEQAIEDQDRAFLASAGVPWRDTIRLNRYVEEFAALWNRR
jgi:predicted dehydrogenase